MKLVSWNVNGIRAVHNKGLFTVMIEELKPDIICLQETKAQQHQSEVDLPEYEEYWNSAEKKGYSGTAIFTKVKPISIRMDLPESIVKKFGIAADEYGNPQTEGRVLAIELEEYFVVTVYTPNSKRDLERLSLRHKHWDPAFLAYCKDLQKEKPVIMCGDFNVAHMPDDLTNDKENVGLCGFTKEERSGADSLIKAGFIDTFRHFMGNGKGSYTWWSNFNNARARNIGWRIDYFFVSKALISRVTHAVIHANIMGSDHCPVSIDII